MSLEQEIFVQFEKPQFEPIHAFGRDLLVKAFTGEEFGLCQKISLERDTDGKFTTNGCLIKATVAVIALHDQDHKRVFPFANTQELQAKVERVAKFPEKELVKIYLAVAPQSGLEEAALEDAEKNSETTLPNSGGSELPENSAA